MLKVCLREHLRELFYNDAGEVTEVVDLAPGSDCVALNIPLGQWHTVEVLESGTVILECKDGAYEPAGEEDVLVKSVNADLVARLRQFLEDEARSCSMEPGCVTPLYVFRMWGGAVPVEEIAEALEVVRREG